MRPYEKPMRCDMDEPWETGEHVALRSYTAARKLRHQIYFEPRGELLPMPFRLVSKDGHLHVINEYGNVMARRPLTRSWNGDFNLAHIDPLTAHESAVDFGAEGEFGDEYILMTTEQARLYQEAHKGLLKVRHV